MVETNSSGFTIIEVLVSSIVIAILAISLTSAYIALNSVAIFSRQKTIGTEVATNRLEFLKSLPYDNLAVVGGAIPHPSPLPNTETAVVDSTEYEVNTSINYADDAFDGCGNYPNQDIKNNLCRNLPEPTGSSTDLNPADYKIINVKVYVNGKKVSELDTNVAARVAETDSTTGSLAVTVIDSAGNPVSGANVNVVNSVLAINVSDSTDSSGVAIFYGLSPSAVNGYVVSASKTSYSSLTTIAPSGGLSPNFSNQNIIVQQSSSVTMTLDPMGQYSLAGEAYDTSGAALSGMQLFSKGGQKKFSDPVDTSYYFDNLSPTDSRPVTDGSGSFVMQNLVPGDYIFCGDTGSTSCQSGGSNYYLVASVPYNGDSQVGPINIPSYSATNPPAITFPFGGFNYYQKARFIFSTNANFPRIWKILNGTASKASGTHSFTIQGNGLSGAAVVVKNSGGDMTASCSGDDNEISCTIDPVSANIEQSNITLVNNGFTLDIPNGIGLLGGINVTP